MQQQPKGRIAKSADSVRSIVVGSLAPIQGTSDYAGPVHGYEEHYTTEPYSSIISSSVISPWYKS